MNTSTNAPFSADDRKFIPEDILRDSLLAHVAAAYFAIVKKLERRTKCSATRGFILSKLRGGPLNKNQIATQLGFDRTVVHRAIQSLLQEGLVSERKASSGRALLVQLTAKGHRYREELIQQRRAADEKLRGALSPEDRSTLLRLLKLISSLDL
jgi:DNA-binding MarR family transcriptional regulator